jgi:hypothetical protein
VRQHIGIVISIILLIDVSQCDFAQQHEPGVILSGGEAVVGGLGDHICEVDALPEHVAGHWGLRRSDAQPLAQDAHEVGQPRPVPEQLLVGDVTPIPGVFFILDELEDVQDLQAICLVRGGVRILDILQQQLVSL